MSLSWPILSEGQWNLVAENITSLTIDRLNSSYEYRLTAIQSGGSAPDNSVKEITPVIFEHRNKELIKSKDAVDLYLWIENSDTDYNDVNISNLIRIDTFDIEIITNLLVDSKNGILQSNFGDNEIFRGFAFFYNQSIALGANGIIRFLLEPTSLDDYILIIPPVFVKARQSWVQIRIYEDTTFTTGTPVTFYNRNRNKTNNIQSIITTAPVGTAPGDNGNLLLTHDVYGFTGVGGTTKNTAQGGSTNPLIINKNKKYLLVIEEMDGQATQIEASALIYEPYIF